MTPDPADVQALFARHYFYFAMLASLGALQIAVSIGGHRGFWLLPGRYLTRIAGAVLICAGVALFFMLPLWVDGPWKAGTVEADSATRQWGKANWGDLGAARNVNDIDGGLSGTGQATWFPLSTLIAVLVSLAAGSVNRRVFPGKMAVAAATGEETDGLDAVNSEDYPSAVKRTWRKFRRELPEEAAELYARSDSWSITVRLWRRFRK